MQPGIYRITRPILALVGEEGSHVAELIPAGDYIKVNGSDSERRVSVVWNRKKATMFISELLLRSEFCPRKGSGARSNTIDSDRWLEALKTLPEQTVLIVDDNPADVVLLKKAFTKVATEINTIVLTDGAAAITFFERIHEEVKPCAIVLDFYLPKRDGLEVLHVIRATPEIDSVPVHILTSGVSKTEEQAARSLGATCHVKPAGLSDLSKFAAKVLAGALDD